jgi:biopolymer transport protein ExbD
MNCDYKRTHRASHGSLTELNITPLLDLVFVLLVIFIITTPQLTNSLELNLPSGKRPLSRPEPKPKIHRILVDEMGTPSFDGVKFSPDTLKKQLREAKSADANLSVIVDGADEALYQKVVDVLDVLQQLEITRVGLATGSR